MSSPGDRPPIWPFVMGGCAICAAGVTVWATFRMERLLKENRAILQETRSAVDALNSSFTSNSTQVQLLQQHLQSQHGRAASPLGSRQVSATSNGPIDTAPVQDVEGSSMKETSMSPPAMVRQGSILKVPKKVTLAPPDTTIDVPGAATPQESGSDLPTTATGTEDPPELVRFASSKKFALKPQDSYADAGERGSPGKGLHSPSRQRRRAQSQAISGDKKAMRQAASSPDFGDMVSTNDGLKRAITDVHEAASSGNYISSNSPTRPALPLKLFGRGKHGGKHHNLRSAQRELLQSLHFFNEAPDDFFLTIEDDLRFETFAHSETIGTEGEYGDRMWFIAEGTVLGFRRGKQQHYIKGEYFGELAVMRGRLRSSTFTATSEKVELFSLSREKLLLALAEFETVRYSIERTVLHRLEIEKYPESRRFEPEVQARVQETVEKLFKQFKSFQQKKMQFELKGKLGHGASGDVYSGFNVMTGLPLAVKKIHITGDKPKSHQLSIETESLIMQRMQHPNVVTGYGMQKDPQNDDIYYILMEIAPLGSVAQLLKTQGSLSEPACRNYTRQILLGLQYLHKNGVLHRDLKPSNLLLASDGAVKLADFGISRLVDSTTTSTNIKGTPAYMSPDAINGKYSIASDVWAVGCCLLEMLTGSAPWSRHKFDCPTQLIFHIATCNASPQIPKTFSRAFGEDEGGSDFWLTRSQSAVLADDVTCSSYKPEVLSPEDEAAENGGNGTVMDLECSPQLVSLLMHMLALDTHERGDCASLLAHDWFAVDESLLVPASGFSFTAAPALGDPAGNKRWRGLTPQQEQDSSNGTSESPGTTFGSLGADGPLLSRCATTGSVAVGEPFAQEHDDDLEAFAQDHHEGTMTFELSKKEFIQEQEEQ